MSGAAAWRSQASRVFAVLGHELRNPLAAGAASVAAAAELTDAGDPRAPFLQQALADLGRLSGLLDRYLEFGCRGSVRRAEVDLPEVARELARRHAGRVTVDAAGAPAAVLGDAALLARAFENLIDNALEAGARAVAITIRATPGSVVADVADDGPGLPAEIADRVFAPCVSGHGSSGVGLALVAEVIAAHGGEVTAAPAARGARFRIRLPAAARSAGAALAQVGREAS